MVQHRSFDKLETKSDINGAVPISVFVPCGKKERGEYALGVAKWGLSFFEWLFEIPYPIPKLDIVAIPGLLHSAQED